MYIVVHARLQHMGAYLHFLTDFAHANPEEEYILVTYEVRVEGLIVRNVISIIVIHNRLHIISFRNKTHQYCDCFISCIILLL